MFSTGGCGTGTTGRRTCKRGGVGQDECVLTFHACCSCPGSARLQCSAGPCSIAGPAPLSGQAPLSTQCRCWAPSQLPSAPPCGERPPIHKTRPVQPVRWTPCLPALPVPSCAPCPTLANSLSLAAPPCQSRHLDKRPSLTGPLCCRDPLSPDRRAGSRPPSLHSTGPGPMELRSLCAPLGHR